MLKELNADGLLPDGSIMCLTSWINANILICFLLGNGVSPNL